MTLQSDFPLSQILWYKIGGTAKYFIEAHTKQDIYDALAFINKNTIKKVFVCGLGSNLIFTDDYFHGCVIRISSNGNSPNEIRISTDGIVEAFAGETLDAVTIYSLNHNLTGLEWAGGLPGTVGAAIRGNVGAYGREIKDSLESAEVLIRKDDETYELKNFTNQELNFSYRHSLIKENPGKMIVLSATFNLKQATGDETAQAKKIYESRIQDRKNKHPLEYPNCGSVFKNLREKENIEKVLNVFPDLKENIETKWYGKVAAGHLIQRLGLQGYRICNAQISEKHALFIINLGGAKAKDVLAIIDTIQIKFQETFGFTLEPEVEIVQ